MNKGALTREWFKALKQRLSCLVCSEDDPCCLEFHHVDPSSKRATIANLVRSEAPIKQIVHELKKCVCLCSNCHKKVHANSLDLRPYLRTSAKAIADRVFTSGYEIRH